MNRIHEKLVNHFLPHRLVRSLSLHGWESSAQKTGCVAAEVAEWIVGGSFELNCRSCFPFSQENDFKGFKDIGVSSSSLESWSISPLKLQRWRPIASSDMQPMMSLFIRNTRGLVRWCFNCGEKGEMLLQSRITVEAEPQVLPFFSHCRASELGAKRLCFFFVFFYAQLYRELSPNSIYRSGSHRVTLASIRCLISPISQYSVPF